MVILHPSEDASNQGTIVVNLINWKIISALLYSPKNIIELLLLDLQSNLNEGTFWEALQYLLHVIFWLTFIL